MDECGAANFFGIKNNTYVTPKSTSILPSITNNNFGEKPGPWSTKLYNTLRGIQYGTVEDKHGWTTVVIE